MILCSRSSATEAVQQERFYYPVRIWREWASIRIFYACVFYLYVTWLCTFVCDMCACVCTYVLHVCRPLNLQAALTVRQLSPMQLHPKRVSPPSWGLEKCPIYLGMHTYKFWKSAFIYLYLHLAKPIHCCSCSLFAILYSILCVKPVITHRVIQLVYVTPPLFPPWASHIITSIFSRKSPQSVIFVWLL